MARKPKFWFWWPCHTCHGPPLNLPRPHAALRPLARRPALTQLGLRSNLMCGMWAPMWPPIEQGDYNWAKYYDDASGSFYYHNESSGQTTYDRPREYATPRGE